MDQHKSPPLRSSVLAFILILLLLSLCAVSGGCGHRREPASSYVGYWWLEDSQKDTSGDAPRVLHVTSTGGAYELVGDGVPATLTRAIAGRLVFVVRRPEFVSDTSRYYVSRKVELLPVQKDRIVVMLLAADRLPAETLVYRRLATQEGPLREGFVEVIHGIEAWARDHGDSYPDPSLVRASKIGDKPFSVVGFYVRPWPSNPLTGGPMHIGRTPGDFEYDLGKFGDSLRFVGFGADGRPLVAYPEKP